MVFIRTHTDHQNISIQSQSLIRSLKKTKDLELKSSLELTIDIDNCSITKNHQFGLHTGNNNIYNISNTELCSNWPYNIGSEWDEPEPVNDLGGNNFWGNCVCETGCEVSVPDEYQTIEEAVNNCF